MKMIELISGITGTGVELGVAEGKFSEQILKYSSLSLLYSIDRWSGELGHNDEQYEIAKNRLEPYSDRSLVVKADVDIVVDSFPDGIFDFLFFDCYAHEGNGGTTRLLKWLNKVKKGGIFAGHDYHDDWMLNKLTANAFANIIGKTLSITDEEPINKIAQYPSWYFIV